MKMVNAKILEIFRSIQGEGKYVGVKQVFVRFFECNMHCDWCDTPHSIGDTTRHYMEYGLAALEEELDRLKAGCHSVSLTGGEPLLQKDFLKELLPQIRKRHLKTYLETNGTLPGALADILGQVDIVAMDIKLPSSTKCRPYWDEHRKFLELARDKDVFVKAVVSSDTLAEDVVEAGRLVADIDPDILFILQPNYFEMRNGVVAKCQELQDEHLKFLNNTRILPQIHKYLKLR